eukprot:jgi/Mesvir1/29297/Mv01560-RA.1
MSGNPDASNAHPLEVALGLAPTTQPPMAQPARTPAAAMKGPPSRAEADPTAGAYFKRLHELADSPARGQLLDTLLAISSKRYERPMRPNIEHATLLASIIDRALASLQEATAASALLTNDARHSAIAGNHSAVGNGSVVVGDHICPRGPWTSESVGQGAAILECVLLILAAWAASPVDATGVPRGREVPEVLAAVTRTVASALEVDSQGPPVRGAHAQREGHVLGASRGGIASAGGRELPAPLPLVTCLPLPAVMLFLGATVAADGTRGGGDAGDKMEGAQVSVASTWEVCYSSIVYLLSRHGDLVWGAAQPALVLSGVGHLMGTCQGERLSRLASALLGSWQRQGAPAGMPQGVGLSRIRSVVLEGKLLLAMVQARQVARQQRLASLSSPAARAEGKGSLLLGKPGIGGVASKPVALAGVLPTQIGHSPAMATLARGAAGQMDYHQMDDCQMEYRQRHCEGRQGDGGMGEDAAVLWGMEEERGLAAGVLAAGGVLRGLWSSPPQATSRQVAPAGAGRQEATWPGMVTRARGLVLLAADTACSWLDEALNDACADARLRGGSYLQDFAPFNKPGLAAPQDATRCSDSAGITNSCSKDMISGASQYDCFRHSAIDIGAPCVSISTAAAGLVYVLGQQAQGCLPATESGLRCSQALLWDVLLHVDVPPDAANVARDLPPISPTSAAFDLCESSSSGGGGGGGGKGGGGISSGRDSTQVRVGSAADLGVTDAGAFTRAVCLQYDALPPPAQTHSLWRTWEWAARFHRRCQFLQLHHAFGSKSGLHHAFGGGAGLGHAFGRGVAEGKAAEAGGKLGANHSNSSALLPPGSRDSSRSQPWRELPSVTKVLDTAYLSASVFLSVSATKTLDATNLSQGKGAHPATSVTSPQVKGGSLTTTASNHGPSQVKGGKEGSLLVVAPGLAGEEPPPWSRALCVVDTLARLDFCSLQVRPRDGVLASALECLARTVPAGAGADALAGCLPSPEDIQGTMHEAAVFLGLLTAGPPASSSSPLHGPPVSALPSSTLPSLIAGRGGAGGAGGATGAGGGGGVGGAVGGAGGAGGAGGSDLEGQHQGEATDGGYLTVLKARMGEVSAGRAAVTAAVGTGPAAPGWDPGELAARDGATVGVEAEAWNGEGGGAEAAAPWECVWEKDEVLAARIGFLLRILLPMQAQLTTGVASARVAPVMLRYLRHPTEAARVPAHLLARALLTSASARVPAPGATLPDAAFAEHLAPRVMEESLLGYPGTVPYTDLVAGLAVVLHLLSGPCVTTCISHMIHRAHALLAQENRRSPQADLSQANVPQAGSAQARPPQAGSAQARPAQAGSARDQRSQDRSELPDNGQVVPPQANHSRTSQWQAVPPQPKKTGHPVGQPQTSQPHLRDQPSAARQPPGTPTAPVGAKSTPAHTSGNDNTAMPAAQALTKVELSKGQAAGGPGPGQAALGPGQAINYLGQATSVTDASARPDASPSAAGGRATPARQMGSLGGAVTDASKLWDLLFHSLAIVHIQLLPSTLVLVEDAILRLRASEQIAACNSVYSVISRSIDYVRRGQLVSWYLRLSNRVCTPKL